MQILENISLRSYNTFHIDAKARYFVEVTSVEQLGELLADATFHDMSWCILGGGSNMLFTADFEGLVVKMGMKGIDVLRHPELVSGSQNSEEMLKQVQHDVSKSFYFLSDCGGDSCFHRDDVAPSFRSPFGRGSEVLVRAMAGENWHDFVLYTLHRGWQGLENLSLIPGTVGAAPIQNIGAYGVEVGERILSVQWLDFETRTIRSFSSAECHFGYRDSIFKHELKGKGAVISVIFRLCDWNNSEILRTKLAAASSVIHEGSPEIYSGCECRLTLDYGAIRTELETRGITFPCPRDVSDVVIAIRESKLPDPEVIGNAGSFFKNPTIPNVQFESLRREYPNIVGYPVTTPSASGLPVGSGPEGQMKVAAGWLIEQADWKGKRIGDAGVHDRQPLVLANHGRATGSDIIHLSKQVQRSVFEKFAIEIEAEVNIIG